MASGNLRINERIRVPQVRVIDLENNQLGVMNTFDAIEIARQADVDLVEVAPKGVPPVCRLMDYGKWKYDQKKKEHRSKVKQHNIVLKEVRLRPKIDKHDLDFKMKRAREFLGKGSKVQFTMLFRGREMMHMDRAMKMFADISGQLEELAKVELPARRQGRRMTMVMAPEIAPKPKKEKKEKKETEKVQTETVQSETVQSENVQSENVQSENVQSENVTPDVTPDVTPGS